LGVTTNVEALNRVSGVTAAALPSAPGTTAMRGFSGGAISLLHDGVRLSTATMVSRVT
jgi:iron complex outermembrane receptor protein